MKLDKTKRNVIIVGAIVLFFIWALVTYLRYGSIMAVFAKLQNLIFWLMFFGLAGAFLYWFLMHKQRVDANFECYKRVRKECLLNKNSELKDLITKGDEKHKSKIYGKVIGYSQRENTKLDENGSYTKEHIFLVRMYGSTILDRIMNTFSSGEIMRVPGSLVDELHGDVYVNCNSFNRHLMYWYPNSVHMDYNFTNNNLWGEANRYTQEQFAAWLPMLMEWAAGIRDADQDRIRSKTGYEQYNEMKQKSKPVQKEDGK